MRTHRLDFWKIFVTKILKVILTDGVGGRLLALLVLPVVAGDGAVSGLRLQGLAVGADEDTRH